VIGQVKKCLWILGLILGTLQVHANTPELASTMIRKMDQSDTKHHSEKKHACEKVAGVEQQDVTCIIERNSRLQIGGNYTRAHLKIIDQPSFNGNLGGAQGIYEFRPWNNFYAALSVNWKQGNTHNGQGSRFLVYADAHERFGYTFASRCRNWTASLFTGMGYRHIGHRLSTGAMRIKFQYNELYVPLGIVSDYMFNSCFAGGLNFIWMPQVYPTVKIAPLKGARWIIKRSINNFLAELPLTFTLSSSRRYTLILKPFYEYWQDGKSTAKTATGLALGLPGNTYNFWGVEVNFGFAF
jgi:hypothetical protein